MWRVDPEIDGQVADTLVGPSHAVSLVLDLFADLFKLHELLSFAVQELPILCTRRGHHR